MSPLTADVIVVGAGPAGVAAAIDLARGGAAVVLVEKDVFPRAKPCAGGVSIDALRRLRYDIAPVTREAVTAIQLSRKCADPVVLSAGRTLIAMTRRAELDAFGLDAALAAGCRLVTVADAPALAQEATGVVLRYPGLTLRGRYLVAADGAGSVLRRLVFGEKPGVQAIALEANVDAGDVRTLAGVRTRVDFGMVKGGYAWVFPKGDHFNVGLYTHDSRRSSRIGRQHLREYASAVLGTDRIADIHGFPIATACAGPRMAKGRVLFVGDAAFASNAISGEGIHGAILTGQLAAASILAGGDAAAHYRNGTSAYVARYRMIRRLAGPFFHLLPLSYPLFSRRLARLANGLGHPA